MIILMTDGESGDINPPLFPKPLLGEANCLYDAAGNYAEAADRGRELIDAHSTREVAELRFGVGEHEALAEKIEDLGERALKNIEKNAKAKTATAVKPASKSTASKPSATVSALAANKNVRQNQMTLF